MFVSYWQSAGVTAAVLINACQVIQFAFCRGSAGHIKFEITFRLPGCYVIHPWSFDLFHNTNNLYRTSNNDALWKRTWGFCGKANSADVQAVLIIVWLRCIFFSSLHYKLYRSILVLVTHRSWLKNSVSIDFYTKFIYAYLFTTWEI